MCFWRSGSIDLNRLFRAFLLTATPIWLLVNSIDSWNMGRALSMGIGPVIWTNRKVYLLSTHSFKNCNIRKSWNMGKHSCTIKYNGWSKNIFTRFSDIICLEWWFCILTNSHLVSGDDFQWFIFFVTLPLMSLATLGNFLTMRFFQRLKGLDLNKLKSWEYESKIRSINDLICSYNIGVKDVFSHLTL